MAQRLSRPLLAACLLLLAVSLGAAQSPGQPGIPPPPPNIGPAPKSAEPAPAAKELSKEEVDALIEKAFGKDSAEFKRPVRLWLADIGMAIAAEKTQIARDDGSIRCT